jgi:hypothetical protein
MLTQARQIHARQILSEHDVLMLLNFELSAYEECADCHFTSVKPVIRDESGSNWRGAGLQADGELTETARTISKQVLHEVHETYNIE